jgi:hypothetical protein
MTYALSEGVRGGAGGWGTATKSRKFAGLIPHGVTGIFQWRNASDRTLTLGLSQPLTEMSTKNLYRGGVKAAGA